MATIKEEWYIIVNPHAGSGKTMKYWVPAERLLKEYNIPFYTVYTTHKHHATQLAAVAARRGYRKIMAVGGDGSIHEVFDGVLSWCETSGVNPAEFYLAVAPIGSGNDWIKSFGIPRDVEKVIGLLAKGKFVQEDVVKLTADDGKVSYMANIGGFGFDSHVCQRVNAQKERGLRSSRIYLTSLIYNIFHIPVQNVAIYCDDQLVYSGRVYDMALGNGSYCGGGMQQCSIADPTDGILDAMVVPVITLGRLIAELPRIYNHTVHESKYILYLRGKKIRIEALDDKSRDIVELDGEIVANLPVTVEVTGQHVNVLTAEG